MWGEDEGKVKWGAGGGVRGLGQIVVGEVNVIIKWYRFYAHQDEIRRLAYNHDALKF